MPDPVTVTYENGIIGALIRLHFTLRRSEDGETIQVMADRPTSKPMVKIIVRNPESIRVWSSQDVQDAGLVIPKEYESSATFWEDVESWPSQIRDAVRSIDIRKKYRLWADARWILHSKTDQGENVRYHALSREYLERTPVKVHYEFFYTYMTVHLLFDCEQTPDGTKIRKSDRDQMLEIDMRPIVVDKNIKLYRGIDVVFRTDDSIPLKDHGVHMPYTAFMEHVKTWPAELRETLIQEDLTTMFNRWANQESLYSKSGYKSY